MIEFPRTGERGVSILGALVVALLLGAGSVATFELASPSLSSVVDESQVAAAPVPAKSAEPKTFADQQEKACKDLIKKSAGLGSPQDNGPTVITKEKGKPAEASGPGVGKIVERDRTEAVVDLCISVQKSKSWSEKTKNKEESYECRGRLAKVQVDDAGKIDSKSSSYAIASKGECRTITCKPAKEPGKLDCVASSSQGYNARNASRDISGDPEKIKLDQASFDSKGIGTTLDQRENDALQQAIDDAKKKRDDDRADVVNKQKDYDKAIKDLADCKSCPNKATLEAAKKQAGEDLDKAKNKYFASQEELDKLAHAKAYLGADAINGPPKKPGEEGGDGTVICKDGVCKKPNGDIVTPPGSPGPSPGGQSPGGDQSSGKSGGGLGDIASILKGLGSLFNKQQQMQCTSDQNQYNQQVQMYQQQLQTYNQQLQQYNYARQLQSYTGSTGFTPEPPTQPSQPCYKPPTTNNCSQSPAQPNPSGCQNGSWRPTYSGACVTGWQCVLTSGTGTGNEGGGTSGGQLPITALLTCQPQVVDVGTNVSITYSCSSGASEGGGFETGGARTGSTTAPISNPPAGVNVATFGLKCTDAGLSATKQCSVQVARPAIVLVANPKAVPSGKTSAIGWVTSGMKSCVISSPTLQSFTDEHKNTTNVNGTVATPPLTQSADFVLKCTTLGGATKEATTRVTIQ